MPQKQSGKIVLEYLDKFPQTPSRTLARMIYHEHPLVFTNIEHIRAIIRAYRKACGAHNAKYMTTTRHFNDKPKYYIPPSQAESWEPYTLPPGYWLILADIHFRYHEQKALDAAINYGLKYGIDGILFNGDMFDFYQISDFCKEPDRDTIVKEIDGGRQFLKSLNIRKVVKAGNHDGRRMDRFICNKAPALWGISTIKFDYLLEYGPHKQQDKIKDLTIVPENQIIQSQHLNILHGHEFGRVFQNPVGPARTAFLKANEITAVAHHHKTNEFTMRTIRDHTITCWSIGCLCELHPKWKPLNDWNHGFATLDSRRGNDWEFLNKRIQNGRVL